MFRKTVCIIVIITVVIYGSIPVLAHNRDEHDRQLEYVLFGDEEYRKSHPDVADKICAIEDAVYLCVDQFNGQGEEYLNNLKNRNISHLPNSISEIDYSGNYAHRRNTHMGWDFDYYKQNNYIDWGERWEIRKRILYFTIDKELISEVRSIAFIQWIKDLFDDHHYDEKCDSFCALVYYVHLIGDNEAAENIYDLNYTYKLTNLHDSENPGIIQELAKHCEVLFQDQKDTYKYLALMSELSAIKIRSDRITSSIGGINSEEEFQEYHQCTIDLLKCLSDYIPKLMMDEDYYSVAFNIRNTT